MSIFKHFKKNKASQQAVNQATALHTVQQELEQINNRLNALEKELDELEAHKARKEFEYIKDDRIVEIMDEIKSLKSQQSKKIEEVRTIVGNLLQ